MMPWGAVCAPRLDSAHYYADNNRHGHSGDEESADDKGQLTHDVMVFLGVLL